MTILASLLAVLSGMPLPILIFGAAALGLAVVCGVVGGVLHAARHKGEPDEFERMVTDEISRRDAEAGNAAPTPAPAQEEEEEEHIIIEDEPEETAEHDGAEDYTATVAPVDEDAQEEAAQAAGESEPVGFDAFHIDEEENSEDEAPKTIPPSEDVPPITENVVLAAGSTIAEDEITEDEEDEELCRSEETSIEYDEDEAEDIPDLIGAPAPFATMQQDGSQAEENEIVAAAVDTAEESDTTEELLTSMTEKDSDLDDFDFEGDFDTEAFMKEIEQADMSGESDVNALLMSLGEDEEEPEEEDEDYDDYADVAVEDASAEAQGESDAVSAVEAAAVAGSIAVVRGFQVPKYRRSFRSKLIQGSPVNKRYYAIIKNELMSYEKIRCSESWAGESYLCGRRTYVRLAVSGKTLCVYLALDPNAYDPNLLHHRDKSGVRKYAATPMMMRVRSDLALRRTLTLILYLVKDNNLRKKADYTPTNYAEALRYKDDSTLIGLNLIKLNPSYVTKVAKADELEKQESADKTKQYRDVTPIKKEQVGNLTDEDIDRLEQQPKRERVDVNDRQNASADGKFVIVSEDGLCHFRFYAPTGRLLLISDTFTSTEMAFRAVNAFRTVIAGSEAMVSMVDDRYFYTLRAHGRVFNSVMYDTQSACLEGFRVARETAPKAVVEYSI